MLLTIGPVHELLQDEVYALPTRLCYITVQTESGTVFISNDEDNWIEVTPDVNSGFITGAAFIKVEDDDALVTVKAIGVSLANIQGINLELSSLLLDGFRETVDLQSNDALNTLELKTILNGDYDRAVYQLYQSILILDGIDWPVIQDFKETVIDGSIVGDFQSLLTWIRTTGDTDWGGLTGIEAIIDSSENALNLNSSTAFYGVVRNFEDAYTDAGYLFYGFGSSPDPSQFGNFFGLYFEDFAGLAGWTGYVWFDSRGVMRVKEEDDQAKLALYDPLFDPKYTPDEENFQRFILQWVAGKIQLGFEVGGTGVLGNVQLLGEAIEGNFLPPSSDPGVAGVIWNNAGTLAISAG